MLVKYPRGLIGVRRGVGGVAGGLYLRRLRQILNLELQAEFDRRVDQGGQRRERRPQPAGLPAEM